MSRPATITVGDDGSTGIRVEYVRHRRALRLWGCHDGEANGGPVEVPVQALVELGVATDELVAPHRFLVFGGRGAVRGGARDLIATYDSEVLARTAFIELRRAGASDWAELVALTARGGLKHLAWFGPRPADHRALPPTDFVPPRQRSNHMQASETVQESTPAQPIRRRRSTRLRLIVAGVLTAAAVGGVAGARAMTHSSTTPAHVVGPSRGGAVVDTGDDTVRRGQQFDDVSRTTVIPPETHAPLDVNADQAQFNGPGGD